MILLLLACRPADAPVAVELVTSEAVPGVPVLSWDASAGSVRVEGERQAFTTSEGDPRAGIAVLGLKAGQSVDLVPVTPEGELDPIPWEVPAPPADLAGFTLEGDPSASALGDAGVLMAITTELSSWLAMVDVDGELIWWTEADPDTTTASPRPTLDGTGVLYAQHDRTREADRSIATVLSWDGRDRRDVRTATGHHMALELPDGRIAWIGHSVRAGDLGTGEVEILSDTLLVEDGGDGEVIFDMFDALTPYAPCHHAQRPVDKFDWHDVYEWTHSNSLVHDPDAGLFFLMSWHMDALLAIDEATGERVWQLGGRDATRLFDAPESAFQHAHTSVVTADEAWVFDNRVLDGTASRLIHYDLTVDPVVPTWAILEAENRNVNFLGDVHPGPGGHVFGGWTVPGDVSEHDARGIEVWRLKLGRGPVLGRFQVVELPR